MDDFAGADDDRHRTLDAKLAEALTKILKGEPARKMALAAERAALSHDMFSSRQCLLLIYQKFRRAEAKSDAAAYSKLENIRYGSVDSSLDMPCMKKGFTGTKRRRSTDQQPGEKSASRPADKPLMNWLSTTGFVPPSVYMGFRLFVLLGRRSGDGSSMLWKYEGGLSPRCRSVSTRRAPSAPAAAPAAESLHVSTAVARVTGWNNQCD